MKTPKRNTTLKRSRKRSHLPALSPAARTIINERLNAIPFMQSTRDTVMASLNAAANKDAETVDVVIQSLEAEDRNAVRIEAQGYKTLLAGVGMRGKGRLMMDSSIDELISQSDE